MIFRGGKQRFFDLLLYKGGEVRGERPRRLQHSLNPPLNKGAIEKITAIKNAAIKQFAAHCAINGKLQPHAEQPADTCAHQ